MRAAIRSLLMGDTEITDVIGDRYFLGGSVDALEVTPAMVVRFLDTTPAPTGEEPVVGPTIVQVQVHDRTGDFGQIAAVLRRVRMVLTSAFHVTGDDGVFVHAKWDGDGAGYRDDGFNTLVQVASFTVLSR